MMLSCISTLWRLIAVAALFCSVVSAEEPIYRLQPCATDDAESLHAWQQQTRITLAVLLKMDDQVVRNSHDERGRTSIPLNVEVLETSAQTGFTRHLVEIDARPDRRIQVVLTIPENAAAGKTPAVVCIHGHGGNRDIVYAATSPYRGFAQVLAESGYVTLSTNVGQHDVQAEEHRTLMGERLWDVIRVVDLAASQNEVNSQCIGCAGLSLGGEMAMWLGAMDTRIAATVSSGFLTTMENLREGHCMCWDFPGLQRRYDFADIYSLVCPRALQCQNGQKEPLPGGFPVAIAKQVMSEIECAYRVGGQIASVELAVHPEGHVFDVPSGIRFLDRFLKAN